MRIALLFNPKAGSAARLDSLRPALAAAGDITYLPSENADDLAAKAVEAATSKRFDRLAVAGGDGTIHAVVNALAAKSLRPPLALLPLGTGNDLCRTLGVPLEPEEAITLLTAPVRDIDLVRITGSANKFSVNAVTGGFSGKVAQEVTGELKQSWGPIAYLRGAVGTLADPPVYKLSLRFNNGPEERIDTLNLVVANARTAAGGFVVAPTASPEDGRFDVVLVRSAAALDLSLVAAHLMEGDYTHDPNVLHREARRLELRSDPPIPISIDGEQVEGDRFTFEIVPRAVRVATGPGYKSAAVRRGPAARAFGVLSGLLRLVARTGTALGWGLILAAAAAGLFGWLALEVMEGRWADWNEAVRQHAIATSSPTRDALAWYLTRLGDWWCTTLVGVLMIGVFAGRRRYLDAGTAAALLLGSAALELALKLTFRVERPTAAEMLDPVGGYSFPSGHAVRATAVYLGLAALLVRSARRGAWRWPAGLLLVLLSVGICWSRVHLRVHWLSDVIGGWVAAACWVAACLAARHHARNRRPVV